MTHSPLPTVFARSRRLPAAFALGFGLVAAPGLAVAQSADEIVRGWLDRMRAGGAQVETAGITYSRGSDTVEVRDLRITPARTAGKPGGTIRVPSLSFVGLARPAAGGLMARSMNVPTVEASADDGSVRMVLSGVEAGEVSLPDFAALGYDAQRPFRSQIKLLKTFLDARAERIRLGRVDMAVRAPDQQSFDFGYDGVTVTGLGGGRVERLTSGAIAMSGRSKDKASGAEIPVSVKIGKTEVVGYDFGAYLRVVDDDAYVGGRGDGVWRDVQKSTTVDGISVVAGPASFSIARASLGAIRARQASAPFGELLDRVMLDPKALDKDQDAAMRMALGLLGAFSLESYGLDGWSIAGPDLDRFLLGRFAMRELSADGLGEFSLDGLDAAGKFGAFRLARFAFGGVKFPNEETIRRAVVSAAAKTDFDPMLVVPTLGFVRIDGVEAEVPGKGRVGLGSVSLDLGQYVKAVPTSLRLVLRNLVAPTSLVEDRKGREMLTALGYDRLDYSSEISMRWDEPTGDFRVDTISAGIANAGTLSLNATLGNVPRALFENPQTADQHVVGLLLKGIGVSYRDESLAERALKVASAQTKQTPDALRATALAFLPQILDKVTDPARRQRMTDAITAFVKAPKSITIASQLTSPVPIMQLVGSAAAAPLGLPDLLKLEATANK